MRKKPVFKLAPITPLNNSLSVIEDDDGSITVQSESYKDQGDHTVTEKTTLRRSQSRSEEEEKDTGKILVHLILCLQRGWFLVWFMVFNATYIVVVSFIGGGNRSARRKPPTYCKLLTNFIT